MDACRPAPRRLDAQRVEQVTGIEPAGAGVAHRCATMTLHLLGGLDERPGRRGRSKARPAIRTWVGWESNPRSGGVRNRCKASVCYQPFGIASSHPLESNQNLSGFSRARRPTTLKWEVAPRVRCWRTCGAVVGACHGTLHRHRSSIVREPRRAQRAPRAWMPPPTSRTHLRISSHPRTS